MMHHTPRVMIALMALAMLTACTHNPATGRSQRLTLSAQEEIALGEEAMPELVKSYGGEVSSSQVRNYVSNVGFKLVQQVEGEDRDLPWEFTVLNSDVINAFALPGGKVFISNALLVALENEAELAGVLGHEIGHVTGQHVDERISQAQDLQIFGAAVSVVAGSSGSAWADIVPTIVDVGGSGYLLKFGRDQESESDVLGMRYMVGAGYDPAALLGVMEVLRDAGGSGGTPEFFSTHPHPETRMETIQRELTQNYAYTQGNPQFQLYEQRFRNAIR